MLNPLPIVIIGAGPVGLAAAATLTEKNLPFLVLEAGVSPGQNFLDYGNVRLFSPWEYNVAPPAKRLLEKHGIMLPPAEELPYAKDIVESYLLPLSKLPEIEGRLRFLHRVVAIGRKGMDKVKTKGRSEASFLIRAEHGGRIEEIEAKAVIDASGTWTNFNPVGSGGIPAIGEEEARSHIRYGIPNLRGEERVRYVDKRVLVVGSGHSATNTLLELVELKREGKGMQIYWGTRRTDFKEVFGSKNDQLPARGELGQRLKQEIEDGEIQVLSAFHLEAIDSDDMGLRLKLSDREVHVDEIIANTGSRPDFSFLREVRYEADPALESVPRLAPLIDPNEHSCGTVRPHGEIELRQPEENFYIVGAKSYGRAPTFLMTTGYEQVRSIVAHLMGDTVGAQRVELKLPDTGVCKVDARISLRKTTCC